MKELTPRQKNALLLERMQGIDKFYNDYAKSVGLSYTSLSILELIYWPREVCTQKYICSELFLPKQSVNAIIKSFWEKGYVELKEDNKDRRNKTIVLTPKGEEFASSILDPLAKIEEVAIGQIPTQELEKVLTLFYIYENNLRKVFDR